MPNITMQEFNVDNKDAMERANCFEKLVPSTPIGPDLLRVRSTVTKEVHRILNDRYSGRKIPDGMHEKMADFAVQLEETLYKQASTFDEYKDLDTLKLRIKEIAKSAISARRLPERTAQIPLPHRPSHLCRPSNTDKAIDYNSTAVQQQIRRILLLRHAKRCPHERGQCPHLAICGNLKSLWSHVSSCSDRNCQFRHCISSRYILAHYSKCDSADCPVCVPVRNMIKSASTYVGRKRSMSASDLCENDSKIQRTESQEYATTPTTKKSEGFTEPQFLEQGVREKFILILEELCRKPYADIFSTPVDEQGLELIDYHDIISEPMDLGTILSRLHESFYRGVADVVADVHLTFNNAMLYNPAGTDVYTLAKTYREAFDFLCQQQIWSLMRNGILEKCDLSKTMYKS